MSCLSCCDGCHGVLHVCPSLIPWADILESLMWRWNLLMTTKCPFEFTSHYLLLCSERCFLNQLHSRLLPILVWLSYWPLSSTCSCSVFISFAAASPRLCLFPSPVTTWSHPRPPTTDCTPTSAGIFQGYVALICLFVSVPGSSL